MMELNGDPTEQLSVQPELGIVSRTLSSSPTVKWILPARIRSPSKNDVVFVGDTSIQLREFITTGPTHLADATGKLDFQTPILAAKVVSAKLEPIPVLEATLNQSGDDERFTINDQPVQEGHPPQILVLSTASCHLIFVYAKERYDGSVRFVYAKRPLLGGLSLAERACRHLAVDPESRAVAVAPSIGHFSLLSMRPIDEIKQQIDEWRPSDPSSFRPWHEQRLTQIDGSIVKIDFLYSPDDEKEKVILALLVANQGQIFLLLYRWDTRMPLHRFKPMRCSGQRLSTDDGFPLLLIPCVSSRSFLLVTESCLVVYDQVTASQANTTRYSFKGSNDAKLNGDSRAKQWTQWARPKRHLQHRQMHDDIFLLREDGVIETCLIDFTNRKVKVTTSITPGSLDICVDSAFCLLEAPAHTGGGDIIIAGGDMTDGGLFQARARQSLERIQTLSNGAPFQDLILVTSKTKRAEHITNTDIFACCGNFENRGTVAQIHQGLEAQVGWTLEHPDVASIERLWTLEDRSQETMLLLSSHHSHTSMLVLGLQEMDLEFADTISCPGLDFNQITLAAAMVSNDLLIQITPTTLNIIPALDQSKAGRIEIGHLHVLCADVSTSAAWVALAHRLNQGYGLSLCTFIKDSEGRYGSPGINQVAQLQTRPLCVQFAKLGGMPVLLVGTEQGDLCVFAMDTEIGVTQILRIGVQDLVPAVDGVSVSSICLLANTKSSVGLILCGLRGGYLVCVEVRPCHDVEQPRLAPKLAGAFSLGSTTVTVSLDHYSRFSGTEASAFALCRSVIKRISLREPIKEVDFEMTDVCITTRNDSSRPQAICNVVHRIQRLDSCSGTETSGLIICVTASDLMFSSLVSQPQAVMRHFPVPGIPKRMIYSKHLNQLVVGIETAEDASRGKNKTQAQDQVIPELYFMTTHPSEPESSATVSTQRIIIGESGERIKALVEYSPTDGSKHFEMIVIAMVKEAREPNGVARPISRVICVSAKPILKGNVTSTKAKLVISFSGKPVTALCPVGMSGLLIGAGNELLLHSLDVDTRRWLTRSRFTLPSPAASIHTQGSLIFVACIKHSLLILQEDNNKLKLYASDSGARVTTNVIAFDRYKAVVTAISEKGTNLIGFAEDRLSTGYKKVFDANVPLMIDRLRQYNTPISGSNARASFVGSTTDGTLYHFITIKPEEWALLDFLQSLWLQEKEVPSTARGSVRRGGNDLAPRPPGPSPAQMHINGDILAGLLEPGQPGLRDLLEARVKLENEARGKGELKAKLQQLSELAEPLLGRSDDIVDLVSIWLRKLLQWPVH